jgi:hypothetical protein
VEQRKNGPNNKLRKKIKLIWIFWKIKKYFVYLVEILDLARFYEKKLKSINHLKFLGAIKKVYKISTKLKKKNSYKKTK